MNELPISMCIIRMCIGKGNSLLYVATFERDTCIQWKEAKFIEKAPIFCFPKIFNLLHFGVELRQGHLSFAGPSVRSAEKCLTPRVGFYGSTFSHVNNVLVLSEGLTRLTSL